MHSNGFIHSDLKPENILFVNEEFQVTTSNFPSNVVEKEAMFAVQDEFSRGNRSNSSSSNSSSQGIREYYTPTIDESKSTNVKIIDFGGVMYSHHRTGDIINTRQYRAPEDLLGCSKWDEKSDMWSIACIFYELYTGEVLFPTHDDHEHLCLIEKIIGRFSKWMVDKAEESERKLFHSNYRININNVNKRHEVLRAMHHAKRVEDVILDEHSLFKDLLVKMLVVDPEKRPLGEELLKHPFFENKYD